MASPPPTLRERRDFLAMNTAAKWIAPAVILQYAPSDEQRVGYTVSKKVGNAVVRNKVKRRLRCVAADLFRDETATLVLIARAGADRYPYEKLKSEIAWALRKVKAKAK